MTHAFHLRKTIKTYSRQYGTTVLLSSHNMLEVEYLCDRVAFLNKGRIVDIGTPADLKSRFGAPNLEEAFVKVIGID